MNDASCSSTSLRRTSTTKFYGSLLVSKFQQAALRRTQIRKSKRIPHFLYVDEFEHFQTETFADILSVAGGLGLRLTMGNQYLGQLGSQVFDAIFGNVGTYIILQIGSKDTSTFKDFVHPYDPAHLARLEPYQAVFKVVRKPPVFKWTKPPRDISEEEEQIAEDYRELLRAKTIEHYGEDASSAQSGQKRTVDDSGCQETQRVMESKKDGSGNAGIPTGLKPNRPKDRRP
jgi:hypothetical protein